MCAIAGYVGIDISRSKILAMLEATAHRGPDDQGIFIKGNVGLGHNRLAIIDLTSAGHQPMFDGEKSICIVFNGEIYNYRELKKELSNDYSFKTKSDTEVILYAYKKWGYSCIKRLDGMFAFVIYDIKRDLLFGARDRRGMKPLKYYIEDGIFAFASEIKGLLPIIKHSPRIDAKAIDNYLSLIYVPAPQTGFKNIYKLPPASYFIYKEGKLSVREYWKLDYSHKMSCSENELIDLIEDGINKAVKERMVSSDVPVGALLSGGVDSSCVVSFMARNSQKPIKTFSLGFNDPGFDETYYARKVARLYATEHSEIRVNSKELRDILMKMPDYYDEPLADSSLMPTICLSEFTRKKVKAVLCGDGGDENFAGYDRYNIVNFGDYFSKVPKVLRTNVLNPMSNFALAIHPNLFLSRLNTFLKTFDLPFYERYLYYLCFFNNVEKTSLYSEDFKKEIGTNNSFLLNKENFDPKLTNLDNVLKFDINSYLPEDLLYKMDTASMHYALEVRAPLLDYELMELFGQIPSNLKIKFFKKKYIFKKMLLEKNILPPEIVNRPKRGFNAPIKKWFKTDLKDYLLSTLYSDKFRSSGIFNNKKLDNYINQYFNSKIDKSNNIFSLMVLSCWINKYFS